MNRISKLLIILFTSLFLFSCGAGGEDSGGTGPNLRQYVGTLIGPGCVTDRELRQSFSLTLSIDDYSTGSFMFAEDSLTGNVWTGRMISANSFNARSDADAREQLLGENMTPRRMDAVFRTCLIADCCVELMGVLVRP